jgi:SAM-dependent methyltransferase
MSNARADGRSEQHGIAGAPMPEGPAEPIGKAAIQDAVRRKYEEVSRQPLGHFSYPVGRESLRQLGYAPEWLAGVPSEVVDRFVGVGNPFHLRQPEAGERVLDVGCGCGLDAIVSAHMVGSRGYSAGLDLTAEMLNVARAAQSRLGLQNLAFVEGHAEALPFEDEAFDQVISNGVLNLVSDKDRVFREIRRVLRPGGSLAVADLIVIETIPGEVLRELDAWST